MRKFFRDDNDLASAHESFLFASVKDDEKCTEMNGRMSHAHLSYFGSPFCINLKLR